MRIQKLFLLSCLFTVATCGLNRTADLLGRWSAVKVTQADKILVVELSEISLEFTEQGHYTFNSTLDYKEAGTFRFEGDKLITTDTTTHPDDTKIVLVEKLTSDTLRLRMKNETDWMMLTMAKN